MDPKARRAMWDYLINLKSGAFSTEPRGIILTTHSMEEADALSDNIAIMVRGQLRALGPRYENGLFSHFLCLKRTFYQDRLGTNTGKTPKLTCLQPNAQEQLRRGFSRHHETGRRTVDSYHRWFRRRQRLQSGLRGAGHAL